MSQLGNHLWQSTLFAAAITILVLCLRNVRAHIRYRLWLAASLKFLVPFSLLVTAGSHLHWPAAQQVAARVEVHSAISQASAPFVVSQNSLEFVNAPASLLTHWLLPGVWLTGFAVVLFVWLRRWYSVHRLVRTAAPNCPAAPLRAFSSESLLEPAVFGVFKPVLLLPANIEQYLTAVQLEAVYAHEMSHVRRRDNLTAALHMFVEALFWFHPLVWWIGRKLFDERELACDQAVIEAGNEPQAYAEGILQVCKFCLASPLPCSAGISGADLKKRIEIIMSKRTGQKLSTGVKLLLICAACLAAVGPFAAGMGQGPAEFEVASIKPSKMANGMMSIHFGEDGRYLAQGMSTKMLIVNAYDVHDFQITGLPPAFTSDAYDIEAKTGDAPADSRKLSSEESRKRRQQQLQALLADRFQLKLHHVTKEMPVYALVLAKGGSKLHPAADAGDSRHPGIRMRVGRGQLEAQKLTMEYLAANLSNQVNRIVIDKTGLTGKYDLTLNWAPDQRSNTPMGPGGEPAPPLASPSADSGPSLFTALEEQLGLKLVPQKGPVDVLVIDHVEKPSAN